MKKLVLFLLLVAGEAFGQTGAALIQYFPGVPAGTCSIGRTLGMNQSTGDLYFCRSGVWTFVLSGGGGGAGLNGCQTATAGNLTCDTSIAVTSGTGGVVSLAAATLPTPPAAATSELAAGPNGNPWWSPGNNSPFVQLATSSDVSNALGSALTAASFSTCNMMGWSAQTNGQTCADLVATPQPQSSYIVQISDLNHVIQNTTAGSVINTLPPPTGNYSAPFTLWIDTTCSSNVSLQGTNGAFINGRATVNVDACGWAHVWADGNQSDWHAQVYSPPGGVTQIQ